MHSEEIIRDVPAKAGRPARRIGQILYTLKGEEWRIPALGDIDRYGAGFVPTGPRRVASVREFLPA